MTKYIKISKETHAKLSELKKNDTDTFNNVVSRLVDLELEFNPPGDIIYEYEYEFQDGKFRNGRPKYSTRLFRVIFGDEVKIEYHYRNGEFQKDIKAWNGLGVMPEEAMNNFIKFIIKESSMYILFEMGGELMTDNIWIKRVLL